MEYTLLKEINKKSLQGYLNGRIFSELYWPTLFPIKNTPFLTFEGLTADEGSRIAADVVSYNSSAPEKSRKVLSKLSGVIPPIRIKRSMKETDINTYNVLAAIAGPDQKAVLDLVFADVDFVVDGVLGRLEWLALQAISRGKITLTKSNNAGVVTENVVDYQVPSGNKVGVATVWSDTVNAKPITDIETVMALALALGTQPKYILMNRSTFNKMRNTAEVKDYAAPYALYGGTRVKRAPGLDVINEALSADGKPTIRIVETSIGIELADHTISYSNPFDNDYVSFIPQDQVGVTQNGPIAEETNPPKQVLQAKKSLVLVSKYSDVDPVAEWTKGEANAFPVWNTVDRCFLMYVNNTAWV